MLSKRRLNIDYTKLRVLYNKAHRTYQSPIETPEKGWMPQWLVNKTLDIFGDK